MCQITFACQPSFEKLARVRFDKNLLLVQRSVVSRHVDDVKTEYSRDHVPLHESLVEVLFAWSKEALPTEEGWAFASALTNMPYRRIFKSGTSGRQVAV